MTSHEPVSYQLELHKAHKKRLQRLGGFAPLGYKVAGRQQQDPGPEPELANYDPEKIDVPLPEHARHIHHIQNVVCAHYKVSLDEMHHGQRRRATRARFLAMWFIKRHHNVTTFWLGTRFGRDHTTAIHALRTVDEWRQNDPQIAADVTLLEQKIGS